MILSHLSYCATLWSQAKSTVIKPLGRLYNRAIKIFGSRSVRWHHCHILVDLNMLSFDNYIVFANANLVEVSAWPRSPGSM